MFLGTRRENESHLDPHWLDSKLWYLSAATITLTIGHEYFPSRSFKGFLEKSRGKCRNGVDMEKKEEKKKKGGWRKVLGDLLAVEEEGRRQRTEMSLPREARGRFFLPLSANAPETREKKDGAQGTHGAMQTPPP
ncbi:hypothetical protein KM043_015368 [Ampulex compressa]|nr:hypothetical protein KM043_015368 [Ampulex compressa]